MAIIKITPGESILFKDFQEGNSVQVRVTVKPSEENEYEKGKSVKLVFNGSESTGKIVSEPLVIEEKREDGCKILSVVVEKP